MVPPGRACVKPPVDCRRRKEISHVESTAYESEGKTGDGYAKTNAIAPRGAFAGVVDGAGSLHRQGKRVRTARTIAVPCHDLRDSDKRAQARTRGGRRRRCAPRPTALRRALAPRMRSRPWRRRVRRGHRRLRRARCGWHVGRDRSGSPRGRAGSGAARMADGLSHRGRDGFTRHGPRPSREAVQGACGNATSALAEGVHASQFTMFTSSSMLERDPGVESGGSGVACAPWRGKHCAQSVAGTSSPRPYPVPAPSARGPTTAVRHVTRRWVTGKRAR